MGRLGTIRISQMNKVQLDTGNLYKKECLFSLESEEIKLHIWSERKRWRPWWPPLGPLLSSYRQSGSFLSFHISSWILLTCGRPGDTTLDGQQVFYRILLTGKHKSILLGSLGEVLGSDQPFFSPTSVVFYILVYLCYLCYTPTRY